MTHRTIAIAALGPSGLLLLAPLRHHTPSGVRLLQSDIALVDQLSTSCGLLILVAHPAAEQDGEALQATAMQAQDHGFGVPTVCIATLPPLGTGDPRTTLAHNALQTLLAHTDADVLLPGDTGVNLATWLAQGVTDMAHALGDNASVSIDMDDLARLLRGAGHTAWVNAQASGSKKALDAAHTLLAHPFLNGLQLPSVRQAAVWITAAPQTFKVREMRDIWQALGQHLHPDATQLYSVAYDERLGDALRVSALFTGVSHAYDNRQNFLSPSQPLAPCPN